MKNLTDKNYLENEVNKNEVANKLLHNHSHFLRVLSKNTKCADTKEAIENFLVIMESKSEHLNKLYKIS
jgi:hypothetical protein